MAASTKEKEDQLLIRSLLKKIGPVDMDLVIGEAKYGDRHMLKLAGKRVEDNEALALKNEAELIEKTKLWKTMTETLRYQAQLRMFEQSQQSEDVYISGKFLLHAISTLEHILWACKNPMLLSEQKLSTPKTPHRRPKASISDITIDK